MNDFKKMSTQSIVNNRKDKFVNLQIDALPLFLGRNYFRLPAWHLTILWYQDRAIIHCARWSLIRSVLQVLWNSGDTSQCLCCVLQALFRFLRNEFEIILFWFQGWTNDIMVILSNQDKDRNWQCQHVLPTQPNLRVHAVQLSLKITVRKIKMHYKLKGLTTELVLKRPSRDK